tara:strand:+ start:1454 stop:2116 length:663 start_codon:yes stop_codon:yes gene_type:complete
MPYPSNKRHNSHAKVFMNLSVNNVIKKYKIKTDLATVLDDKYLQSAKTCQKFKKIIITQNDYTTFKHIHKQLSLYNNIECHYKDYADLLNSLYYDHDHNTKIDLDHADFCNTWDTNKNNIFQRLQHDMYSDTSILRLTVSMRGMTNSFGHRKGMTLDKCITKIETDLKNNSYGYTVTPLRLKEWGMPLKANGFDSSIAKHCTAYTYGNMINMICLITRKF